MIEYLLVGLLVQFYANSFIFVYYLAIVKSVIDLQKIKLTKLKLKATIILPIND